MVPMIRRSRPHDERGVVLLAAFGVALLLMLTALAFVVVSTSHAKTARYYLEHLKARYAAEAGTAWAAAQLIADPAFNAPNAADLRVRYQSVNKGPQDLAVNVTITPIAGDAAGYRRITSHVDYEPL